MNSDEAAGLFARALETAGSAADSDDAWDLLRRAAESGPAAVRLAGVQLAAPDPAARSTACDLLGLASEAHEEIRQDAAAALVSLAATEVDGAVRWSIAADLGATTDARGTAVLVAFAADADAEVRLEVARSLPAVMPDGPDDAGVAALIDLCRDADPEVRNWATFGLGWQSTADGRTVRRALWERTGDSYPPVREEGIRGLARRRDQRALPMVADLLAEESVDGCTFEAAGYLGQPSLVPLLERFDPAGRGVAAARRECDPRRRGRRDTLALRLLDAVRVHLPVGQISIFCEHFELGLHLEVTDARPGLGPLRWSVEALLERADDDPDLAARLVTHDLAS